MTRRAIYDSMVFYQWAALPPEREHGTIHALRTGQPRLCMSAILLSEIRGILSRPAIRAKSLALTDERVAEILGATLKFADWFDDVPDRFSLPIHTKHNHLFNLAIASRADLLVTFENRLPALEDPSNANGQRLRAIAPALKIVRPDLLSRALVSG